MTALQQAALLYGTRGISIVPTVRDEDGIAKKPLDDNYARFKAADNALRDWENAAGLAVILGKPSGNLAVVDIDDAGLADFLRRNLSSWANPPLMTRTAKGRLHVYALELTPSRPVDLSVSYQGRRCLVQLLGSGCCAAAPPTPGYEWCNPKAEPLYGNIGDIWRRLSLEFGLFSRTASPYSNLRRARSRGPTTSQLRESLR